jgi:hypothetical protein
VVVVMLMLLLVASFTTAAGLLTQQNYTNTAWRERNLEAQYAFRAGLSTAMEKLTANPAWAPTEASPYVEYLDASERIGFKVWVDGINTDSDTPVTSATGLSLSRGQASMRVIALVNGREMSSGFGGAESTPIIVRPPMEFSHNLMQPDPALPLILSAAPASLLSYNSGGGILPWNGLPAAPPPDNQRASVRSLSDIDLAATRVYGEAILPTISSLSLGGGSSNGEVRLDDAYLPRKFSPPDTSGGLASPPGSGAITPDNYGVLSTGDGATLSLSRGGVYFFSDIFLGPNNTLDLTGPAADGPCVVYTHSFDVGANGRINMPALGLPPIPSELQIYGTPMDGCDQPGVTLQNNAEAAFVTAGNNMGLKLQDDSKLYGAAVAANISIGTNVEVHFDEALLGDVMQTQAEWVMVSQGMR